VVSIRLCKARFDIKVTYILPTHPVCVFHTILRIEKHYTVSYCPVGLCDGKQFFL
jgi:hypothetical protein